MLRHVDPTRPASAFARLYAALATTRFSRVVSRHVSWKLDPMLLRATGGRLATTLVFPTPPVLAPLLEHAQRGDIKQVLEHAGRIEAADLRYGPFVSELRALAQRFQVNKLCQFLEKGQPAS